MPGRVTSSRRWRPPELLRLYEPFGGESPSRAGVAGIDDERAGLHQQGVVDCIVIGANDRELELGQRFLCPRYPLPAGKLGMFPQLWNFRDERIVEG